MRVGVDPAKCQGHNRCKAIAPDLFEIDELGYAHAKHEVVPLNLERAAGLAVANCPEQAIWAEEDDAGVTRRDPDSMPRDAPRA